MRTSTAIKLILVGLLLVAAGLGVGYVRRRTAPERVRRDVLTALRRVLAGEVRLDSARLRPGALVLEGLVVEVPGGEEPLLQCPRLTVDLDLARLALLQVRVRRVTLEQPVVDLRFREESRKWNVAAAFAERPAPAGPPPERRESVLAGPVVFEDATVRVASRPIYRDPDVREYVGVYATVQRDRGPSARWLADLRILDGPLNGAHAALVVPGGNPRLFTVDLGAAELRATPDAWALIPSGTIVRDRFGVEGRLGVRAMVRGRKSPIPDVSVEITGRDLTLKTPFWPTRIESAGGTLLIAGGKLIIRDATGVVPADAFGPGVETGQPARAWLNGVFALKGGSGTCTVRAVDLPLCPTTLSAIPNVGDDLWERLRPTGRAAVTITVTKPSREEPTVFTATAELQDARLAPPEFPAPIEHVVGTVVVDSERARLSDVHGLMRQPQPEGAEPVHVPVSMDGSMDFRTGRIALRVEAENLKTTRALVEGVPGVGGAIWEHLRPDAMLDATVLLDGEWGSDDLARTVVMRLHGGLAQPSFWDLPLTDVVGTVRIEGDEVLLEQLTATVDTGGPGLPREKTTSTVAARGKVRLAEESGELYVTVGDIMVTEQLLRTIPKVGEAVWEEIRPEGMVSVRGKAFYEKAGDPQLRYYLDIGLEDLSLLPKLVPLPMKGFSGQLLITEEQAISNEFVGLTCGGHFVGAAVVYYGRDAALPSYGTRLNFAQIELSDLIECITGEEGTVSGRLSGDISLGGIVGEPAGTGGKGVVELSEGYLWRSPFFTGMLNVLHLAMPAGEGVPAQGVVTLSLSGDEVTVHGFDLTGGGLSLSGYGTVKLDGTLDMTMVAVGAPEKGSGIPILSPVVGWFLQAVERQLVRLEVSGTLQEPQFEHQVLSKVTWPLTSLRGFLFAPSEPALEE